jgi:hypothetical protein
MRDQNIQERATTTLPGVPMFLVLLLAQAASIWWLLQSIRLLMNPAPAIVVTVVIGFLWVGFFIVQPNQTAVLQFFGRFVGVERKSGPRWANPFYTKKTVTLRVRNFESSKLKVNDLEGSPIEIAAVDLHDDHKIALRSHSREINEHLRKEIQDRLERAGVTVLEARVSHLAYAPEIAQAMLQRQQAAAIIAARTRIVEGAVTIVHMALDRLAEQGVVRLDEERKAAMVSNLLVVLCGERGAQPVVNTGTLYNG